MTPGRASVETVATLQNREAQTIAAAEPSFIIQLGAFRSEVARCRNGRLQVVFPDNRDLAALNISPGEDSNGGSVFRIMTDAMPVTEAEHLCGLLWSDMVSCVLKAVPSSGKLD